VDSVFNDDDLDFWRLCDEVSVQEAALLVAGVSPAHCSAVERWASNDRPTGYDAAKTAILNAFRSGKIPGTVVEEIDRNSHGDEYPVPNTVSINSRVEVDGLRKWLQSRGLRTGFFFPAELGSPDYLNPLNPRYAHKLAAAVRAWQAVTDPVGKHPKQALVKWLREHAAELGLSDDDGKPNETGIDEVAKVANWQPGGGAPKTPGG
jgi:hypothetical protein